MASDAGKSSALALGNVGKDVTGCNFIVSDISIGLSALDAIEFDANNSGGMFVYSADNTQFGRESRTRDTPLNTGVVYTPTYETAEGKAAPAIGIPELTSPQGVEQVDFEGVSVDFGLLSAQ